MTNNKDPAFMFYPSDFMVGTFLMTDEEVGKYIRLLCLQHQQGHLPKDDFEALGGTNSKIKAKFIQDDQGLYYNERLDEEIAKRTAYKNKLRENGSLGGKSKAKAKLEQGLSDAKAEPKQRSSTRVENENGNENINNKVFNTTTTTITPPISPSQEGDEKKKRSVDYAEVAEYFIKHHYISSSEAFYIFNEQRGWQGIGGEDASQNWEFYSDMWELNERRKRGENISLTDLYAP